MGGGRRQKQGGKDKFVVAVLKAGVSGSVVVNHTLVSKENIRATCQQLVHTGMPNSVCACLGVCVHLKKIVSTCVKINKNEPLFPFGESLTSL